MKNILRVLFALGSFSLFSAPAFPDYVPGQILTAAELNASLAAKTDNSAAAITGGTVRGAAISNSTVNSSAIGESTPSTGAFTDLTVTGIITLSASNINFIPLTYIAQSAANTMLGNWTGSLGNVSANVMPSCADTSGQHLNYVNGSGITCGTSDAVITLDNIAAGLTDSTLRTQNGTTGNGFAINITSGNGRSGFTSNGGGITITSGSPYIAGVGGTLSLLGGDSLLGATGSGGPIVIRGGYSGESGGVGGAVTVTGGSGRGGNAGSVTISGGLTAGGTGPANGGSVVITGTAANGLSAVGGNVTITAGASVTAATGGALAQTAGQGGATGNGGPITITSGAGGATSGNSGDISLVTGTVVSGTVGSVAIKSPATFGTVILATTIGAIGMDKIGASGSAPGAGGIKLEAVCGTNPGTAKLIMYAGTSSTPVTVLDNVGSGVSGC